MIGFGVTALLVVVVVLGGGGAGCDASRYTGGGGCLMDDVGGITTEPGATIGLDRNIVCNGSSTLSSLDGGDVTDGASYESLEALPSFTAASLDD